MRPPRRVLLTDDDWTVRHALRARLAAQPQLTVIAEAADGHQAMAQAARHQPHVVVLDHDVPTLTGLQALPALRAQLPHAVIVMCSANADRIGEDARQHSADAVIDKSRTDALIAAVLGGFDRLQHTSKNLTASAESGDETDPSNQLPAELRAELDELTAIADAIEPAVADLAERYHRLGRWDHAWPLDPTDRATLDPRVLAASGDDRLRAVLTSIAVRADVTLEGAHTLSVEIGGAWPARSDRVSALTERRGQPPATAATLARGAPDSGRAVSGVYSLGLQSGTWGILDSVWEGSP